ncbi:MAG: helix-turn-helix domain-containing protein [Beijerinckiaceae bacterium]
MKDQTTPGKDALRRAADLLGGQAALAELLGCKDRRNVWPWFNTDRKFPAEHCPLVERATGVTCEELRPDVQWDVLRTKRKAKQVSQSI